ncbi:MAG: hypothetical protein KA139_07635 [Rhodobacteraceae bacterium]|nr:hypothetical protein [Paracoccaceae bacterium]
MTKAKLNKDPAPVIHGIKGFDKDMKCRGIQFEIGQTYTHEGDVVACGSGYHAVPNDLHPLTVFEFYAPAGNRFCRVEVSGKTDREENKIAAEILEVGEEIGLRDLTQDAVKWVMDRATPEGPVAVNDNGLATASGTQGAATASGTQGAATASGYQGAATASGYQGAATASGYQGAATASGYQGAATASGDQGAATASGTQGAATASGYQGAATALGTQGAATASGTQGAATASGYLGNVKGADGNALFAVERATWNGPILSVACGVVGVDGVKADIWYRCQGGKLVEA